MWEEGLARDVEAQCGMKRLIKPNLCGLHLSLCWHLQISQFLVPHPSGCSGAPDCKLSNSNNLEESQKQAVSVLQPARLRVPKHNPAHLLPTKEKLAGSLGSQEVYGSPRGINHVKVHMRYPIASTILVHGTWDHEIGNLLSRQLKVFPHLWPSLHT